MVAAKKVLRKSRIREIVRNYKSFLSIILIAALCVALFTGLYANYRNFEIRVNEFYDITHMADYFVTTNAYDEEDLEGLKKAIPEIDEIEERIYMPLQMDSKSITMIAVSDDAKICKPITEGTSGVYVSQTFLDAMEVEVSDMVTLSVEVPLNITIPSYFVLEGGEDYLSNNEVRITFQIQGVMEHPEDVEKNSTTSGLIYMNFTQLEDSIRKSLSDTYASIVVEQAESRIELSSYVNQYVIRTDENISERINTYFMEKEHANLLSSLARDSFPTNSSIENDVNQAKQLLFVFPVVFYLVGVLVIITSLKELIHKERKNIGVFSALGFSKREIIMHYSYISILLVSIGSLLGLLVGPLLIPSIMGRKYNVLYNLPSTNVPIFYLPYLYCFLIIVGISVLACVLVAYKEVNQNPAVILRNEDRKSLKTASNFKPRKKLLPLKMSFRSMRLNKVRSFMVLIGVMGCSALLVCGFGIDDTLNHSVAVETEDLIAYDLMVSYSKELDLSSYEIKSMDSYERMSVIAIKDGKSYNTSIYIFEGNREIFKPVIPESGCMITQRIAEDLNVSLGDTITYIYNNSSIDVEVTAIEELSFTAGIFISNINYEGYTPNGAYITLEDSTKALQIKEELLSTGASSVLTGDELEDQADNILSGIRGITLTVKVFAILLALVVIYNLAQLNYKERIRDIATLKVLGFGKFEIAQTLLYELTTLTLFGSIFGMLCGKPLLVLLLRINQTARFTYIYYIQFSSYLLAILLTLVISILINLVITKLSDRIQMVESLKSVE